MEGKDHPFEGGGKVSGPDAVGVRSRGKRLQYGQRFRLKGKDLSVTAGSKKGTFGVAADDTRILF